MKNLKSLLLKITESGLIIGSIIKGVRFSSRKIGPKETQKL